MLFFSFSILLAVCFLFAFNSSSSVVFIESFTLALLTIILFHMQQSYSTKKITF